MADTASQTCTTCGVQGEDFYSKDSTECRPCKRDRSRQNRQIAARKVELADRLLDIVECLAGEGYLHELALAVKARGPVSDSTAAGPH